MGTGLFKAQSYWRAMAPPNGAPVAYAPMARIGRRIPGAMAVLALSVFGLAGCATPDLDDPRARALMSLPGPQYFAEQKVAQDLAARCPQYSFDSALADAMNETRLASGIAPGSTNSGSVDLETDVKQRSLASYYGQSSFAALNACETLDQETARRSALSVLVKGKG